LISVERVTPMADTEQVETKKKKWKKRPDPVVIYRKWCKSCNICIEMCPKDVFDIDRDGYPVVARGLDCTQCSICWLHCPEFAITSKEK
jgi:2-oxoglutarate ferredoxin oxidoreductase subunit delta